MHTLQSIVITAVALTSLTHALVDKRQNVSQLPSCPGVVNIQSSSTICCVGGSLSLGTVNLSSCPGWPICTGPVTVSTTSRPQNPPLTCASVIDMNNPSYSSILASVTASIQASGTRAATTINPTGAVAAPGSSGSNSAANTASATRSGASGSSSGTASASANGAVATSSRDRVAGAALVGVIGAAAALVM